VSREGEEEAAPGTMSFSMKVPPDVPSLVQSSVPFAGVVALKNSRAPTAVRPERL
jgi:hypothetical protein